MYNLNSVFNIHVLYSGTYKVTLYIYKYIYICVWLSGTTKSGGPGFDSRQFLFLYCV